ncbi:MAG: TrmH family RNA methyltransferase [Spirochaetales bacterium]
MKLLSLPSKTKLRKLLRIIHQWVDTREGSLLPYLDTVSPSDFVSLQMFPLYQQRLRALKEVEQNETLMLHNLFSLRHLIEQEVGIEQAEWDLYPPFNHRSSKRRVFPIRLYLDELRSPFNVGSIFRSADCFGIERIYLAPGTASPEHRRAVRSAMGATHIVPWEYAPYEALQEEEHLFALETGGTPIESFMFPPSGICIIGSEELGIYPTLLDWAKKRRGIVTIPLFGVKGSLNVAVAAGILMHAWVQQLVHHSDTAHR